MSKRDSYFFDDEQDYRRVQKSNNRRNNKKNRHENRQNLNDIANKINNGYDPKDIEEEYEEEDYE